MLYNTTEIIFFLRFQRLQKNLVFSCKPHQIIYVDLLEVRGERFSDEACKFTLCFTLLIGNLCLVPCGRLNTGYSLVIVCCAGSFGKPVALCLLPV